MSGSQVTWISEIVPGKKKVTGGGFWGTAAAKSVALFSVIIFVTI
jgi:hypothetical protein